MKISCWKSFLLGWSLILELKHGMNVLCRGFKKTVFEKKILLYTFLEIFVIRNLGLDLDSTTAWIQYQQNTWIRIQLIRIPKTDFISTSYR
jgi:hypothetical protein